MGVDEWLVREFLDDTKLLDVRTSLEERTEEITLLGRERPASFRNAVPYLRQARVGNYEVCIEMEGIFDTSVYNEWRMLGLRLYVSAEGDFESVGEGSNEGVLVLRHDSYVRSFEFDLEALELMNVVSEITAEVNKDLGGGLTNQTVAGLLYTELLDPHPAYDVCFN